MLPLIVVLAFPLILLVGYTAAYLLLRRDARPLTGPVGLMLYQALLMLPLATVVTAQPDLPGACLAWQTWSPAWLVVGVATGAALVGVRWLMASKAELTQAAAVWVGPPGWGGYAIMLAQAALIVGGEEIVWRGYVTPTVGVWLASAAFALHHYFFGLRHVLFTFVAGVVWAGLFLAEERLYAALASHFTYNALAWAWMRRIEARPRS